MIEPIELQTNDDRFTLRMSGFEKFTDGEFRCELCVRSGGFSCQRPFYFDDSTLPDAVATLQQMDSGQVARAILKARWEDDFISFESDKLGHVFVSGEIFEHGELSQSMKFEFRTDQTVLGQFVRRLANLLPA